MTFSSYIRQVIDISCITMTFPPDHQSIIQQFATFQNTTVLKYHQFLDISSSTLTPRPFIILNHGYIHSDTN